MFIGGLSWQTTPGKNSFLKLFNWSEENHDCKIVAILSSYKK